MYLRRSAAVKYFGFAFLGSILYSEFFVYILQPIYWNRLRCPQNDLSCTKILFVADPQIQGELAFEAPWSYIINWDSDRYLRSTFSVAVKHFRPDVVVYLGDLTDEGSVATMPQFHGYVKRLLNIFDVDYPLVQIWTPGDNDIGGENEPVHKNKVEEFEKVFYQLPVITYRNVTFYKVNGITRTYPRREEDAMSKKLGIVVSHYPITSNSLFGKQVHEEIRPNIYFCAHAHDSKYVTQNEDLTNRVLHRLKPSDGTLRVNFSDASLIEIHVPTCSYRMGTDQMGYGAAVLENYDSVMKYTVFWSPKRFPYLVFYLVVLIILIVYCLIICAKIFLARKLVSVSRHTCASKLPLLEGA